MIRIIIEPGTSWAYLAYKYLGSSSKFRDLLDANPQYNELDQPKPGDVVVIPTDEVNNPVNARALDNFSTGIITTNENIYPWTNLKNYLERLATYHPFSLENIEECNGDSLDPATEPYIPEEEILTTITNTSNVVNFNLL